MKVAISVPDPLFEAAELICKDLQIPRSQVYARALEDFVKSQRHVGVREALDMVYGQKSAELDPMLEDLQAEALHEDW